MSHLGYRDHLCLTEVTGVGGDWALLARGHMATQWVYMSRGWVRHTRQFSYDERARWLSLLSFIPQWEREGERRSGKKIGSERERGRERERKGREGANIKPNYMYTVTLPRFCPEFIKWVAQKKKKKRELCRFELGTLNMQGESTNHKDQYVNLW